MNRLTLFLGAGIALLGGCADRPIERPYFTQPPQILLPSGARYDRNLVSVCYSSSTTTPAALRQKVLGACENAEMIRQDLTGNCTMLQPVRATFTCTHINADVAKIEKPFGLSSDGGRFRSEPLVPGDLGGNERSRGGADERTEATK